MKNDVQTHAYWGVVGTVLWGVLIFIITNMAQVVAMMACLKYQGRPMSDLASAIYDGNALSAALVGSMIATFITVYWVIKFKKGSNIAHYLALNPLRLKELPKWILGLVILLGLATAISYADPGSESATFMVSIFETANPKWVLFLGVVLMAPLAEEFFFRGFLFKGLQHSFLGVSGAIVVTSACWAMMHLQYGYQYIAMLFVVGLYLGYARYRTNSIWLPLVLHMLYNAVAMLGTAFVS